MLEKLISSKFQMQVIGMGHIGPVVAHSTADQEVPGILATHKP